MRKMLLGLVVFVATSVTYAQNGLGIQAGINFSNVTGKDADGAKIKTGFQGGINYNIAVADEFVIQPGLNYVQNGFKANSEDLIDFDIDESLKINLPFLQLPILFQYRPEFTNGSKMVLGAGPYAAYGIGKIKVTAGSVSETANWEDIDGEEGINRFDAGAKMLIGYEMINGLSLNLNADLGLTKFVDDTKSHHTAFGITLGYRFK